MNVLIGLDSIKVLLMNDDGSWFAQGLEIDYAAEGTTELDVKKRFEFGLVRTLHAHLETKGTIDGLLKVAPKEIWETYFSAAQQVRLACSTASIHFVPTKKVTKLPPQEINLEYLQPA